MELRGFFPENMVHQIINAKRKNAPIASIANNHIEIPL